MDDSKTKSGESRDNDTAWVNCEKGREMGCDTFCCRLIVRLKDDERPGFDGAGTIEKLDDGLCRYLDRDSFLCTIWEKRPKACREYTCNDDELLQIILREGFSDLKSLVTSKLFVAKETYIKIPKIDKK